MFWIVIYLNVLILAFALELVNLMNNHNSHLQLNTKNAFYKSILFYAQLVFYDDVIEIALTTIKCANFAIQF